MLTSYSWQCPRLIVMAAAIAMSACGTMPKDAFKLTESSLEIRKIQTRVYSSADDSSVITASAAVLQDMGYVIDEIEYSLGVISASKRADASNTLEALGSTTLDTAKCMFTLFLACSRDHYGGIDDVQDIRLTLVSMPQRGSDGDVAVRITIQRVVFDKRGRVTEQSTVANNEVYEALFAKLSKAVFLEQEGI